MTDIGWRKTWEDVENDYVGFDGETKIGRVYLVTTSGTAPYWAAFPAKGGGSMRADSRRVAMLAVERVWEKALEGGIRQNPSRSDEI